MTVRDELIEKMARAICCPSGCNFARQCDATTDLAQERQREASAALAVITEWLEGERDGGKIVDGYSLISRLIAMLKGE